MTYRRPYRPTRTQNRASAENALAACMRKYEAGTTGLENLKISLDFAQHVGVNSPTVDRAAGLIAKAEERS